MTETWGGKRVLVTGAGGFIGSHLTERLVHEGARVRAFIRYNSRGDLGLLSRIPPRKLNEIDIIAGDLRDPQAVRDAVDGVEYIFHLGALISIPYSYRHPYEVAETNIMGTLNVLMAARDLQVTRVVHTSTSEVYGSALKVPIDEDHPLQGQSPYSASKIGADKLTESFFCTYDLPVVTLRPFNTYGPRQSARAVIPTIITQALTKDAIRLGALDTLRDFTYVDDTVDGFIKAASTPDVQGETIHLGTGREVSIRELCETIIRIVNRPISIETDPDRMRPNKSEVQRLLSDNSHALETIGWEPRVSLEDGLSQTIDWIQENLQNYRIGVYEF